MSRKYIPGKGNSVQATHLFRKIKAKLYHDLHLYTSTNEGS